MKNIDDLAAKVAAHLPQAWQPELSALQQAVLAPQMPLRLILLGSFSVGKSSLLNMLLEQKLLYTAQEEATALPTFIEYGPAPAMALVGPDGSILPLDQQAFRGATAQPPQGAACATLTLPLDWLRGVSVIDLPGLGSVSAERMEYTSAQIQQADAVLYLIEPRGPTQLDLAALRTVRQYGKRVLVAVARWDVVEEAARHGEKAPELARWAAEISAQTGLQLALLPVDHHGLGRAAVLDFISDARDQLLAIRRQRFQAELLPLLQNALGSNRAAQQSCAEQSESDTRALHAAVLTRKQQLLQTKQALYQRQQDDKQQLETAANGAIDAGRHQLARNLQGLQADGPADWAKFGTEGAGQLREALAALAAALSGMSASYGALKLPAAQISDFNLRLPTPAPIDVASLLESGKLQQLEQALLEKQGQTAAAQRRLQVLPEGDVNGKQDEVDDLVRERQLLLSEPLARIIERTEGNGASQLGRFIGEVADIALMFANPTAVGAKVGALVGKGAKVAKIAVNVKKVAKVAKETVKIGQAVRGARVHPVAPQPVWDKLGALEMLSLGYWGERIGNALGGAPTERTVVDPAARLAQQQALAALEGQLQQARQQLARNEHMASERQLSDWALEQSQREAETLRLEIAHLGKQAEQREQQARQQAAEQHQQAVTLAVQRACADWLRSYDQQAAGMGQLLRATVAQYWEQQVESTLSASLADLQTQSADLEAAPQVRQQRLQVLRQEADGLAAAIAELQMNKPALELNSLLAMAAPLPLENYVEQLASLSAGTVGMAQLLQGFAQQLQRLEQLQVHTAREMALEIAAVGRANTRRRAGTIADGLAGWCKIGDEGELLLMESEVWSAALDYGYELMWTVNTSLGGEWPHRCGRSQWKLVQSQLAQLNSAGWCGYRDWRLPTLDELLTLQHTGKEYHAYCLSSELFPDVQGTAEYWSCSADEDDPQLLQMLSFADRAITAASTAAYGYCRFVRSAPGHG